MNIAVVAPGLYWASAARLPAALQAAGFRVFVCCPRNSLIATTRFADGFVGYDPPIVTEGVFVALETMRQTWGIDLILPGDDPGLTLLHAFAQGKGVPPEARDGPVRGILARSLGDPRFHDAIDRKSAFAEQAIPGLRCPRQTVCDAAGDLFAAAGAIGYPLILKRDFMSGGTGVHGIGNEDELRRLVESLEAGRAPEARARFILQERIEGAPAATSFSAVNGRVLASFAYRQVCGQPAPFGPASVVEVIDNRAMIRMTETLAARIGFTGFGGLDFMIDANGEPFFLEFNGRPTLTTHLGPVMGADLCAAFHAGLSGGTPAAATRSRHRFVALFPREWQRDPNSPYLHDAYHDVPWNDSGLMRAFTQTVLQTPPAR